LETLRLEPAVVHSCKCLRVLSKSCIVA
jgi:hypothetical protein